jgi:predicted unusual protein kinase regulating ubiquinone biosynthesis (AarF/ABC1/UbiB family)
MGSRDDDGVARGRARRVFKVGELAGALGSSYVLEALKRPFRSADRHQQEMLDTHVRNALKIVARSEELRGAFTKLVQMLSMRDDMLPAEVLNVLSAVQSKVPPMDYTLIREQVTRELGRPPDEVFARFDELAFAAASLGQVHTAQLPDGRDVVVKVQYPQIEQTVQQDLDNLKALLHTFAFIGRDVLRQKIDVTEIYQELEDRLREELDYVNEAQNIVRFQEMFAPDAEILIPEVYPGHSSRRVLTMSRIEGYPFADILVPGVDQSLKDWVARKYFRTLWRQILEFGVLHTDPHPGNYLVTYHPRLGILDFGSVRIFPDPIRRAYLDLMRTALSADRPGMSDALTRLGFLDAGDDPKPLLDILDLMWEPVMIDRPFNRREFHAADKAIEAARIGFEARLFKRPGHSIFVGRALLGLDAYLLQFGTVANWHRELGTVIAAIDR